MTWIELEGANTAFDDGITSGKGYAFQGSLFKLGPEFSFGLGATMAIDMYYQIAPAFAVFGQYGEEDAIDSWGFTHAAGLTFRISKFNIGFEYSLGNVIDNDYRKGGDLYVNGVKPQRYNTTSMKVILGFQFNK